MNLLATTEACFQISGVEFQINAGTSCNTAITAAGAMLSSVNHLLSNLIGDGVEGSSELYAIRVLTSHCEALLEAIELPVRDAEVRAPQNQTAPVRGAEASQCADQ